MTRTYAGWVLSLVLVLALATGCDDAEQRTAGDAPPRPGGAEPGTVAPVTPVADASTPQATAVAWTRAVAAGDLSAARALSVGDDEAFAALEAMVAAAASSGRMRAAFLEKFDAAPPTFESILLQRTQSTTEQIDGDVATVTPTNGNPPLQLKRQPDGGWKVDIASEFAREPGIATQMQNVAKLMDEMAAETAAGRYRMAGEARHALAEKYKSLNSAATTLPAAGDGFE